MSQSTVSTVDNAEVKHFQKLAESWWDENGVYKSLHQLNPVRLQYIRDHIFDHFNCTTLENLNIIDIGCGGGLLCEPLARMGAKVKGIDATQENITCARLHAKNMGLNIDYQHAAAEDIQGQYDVVLAMEIIEHVADVKTFVKECSRLLRPGGLIFLSTLNRTWKSYVFGIVAAEYVLGWVPKGTHQWNKFVTPDEMTQHLEHNNINLLNTSGVILDPLRGDWKTTSRLGVNYMCVGIKEA